MSSSPLIISEKFRNKIATISYLEFDLIELYNTSSKKKNERIFYVVKSIKEVDAIDFDKSIITFYTDSKVIRKVEKLILIDSIIKDEKIFKVKGLSQEVFVNMSLKEELLNLKGLKLTPTESYKKGIYDAGNLW